MTKSIIRILTVLCLLSAEACGASVDPASETDALSARRGPSSAAPAEVTPPADDLVSKLPEACRVDIPSPTKDTDARCAGDNENRVTMVRLACVLFQALQQGDFGIIEPFLMTGADHRMVQSNASEGQADTMSDADLDKLMEIHRYYYTNTFQAALRSDTVNWRDARFVGAFGSGYQSRPNIYLVVEFEKERYQMKMDDSVCTPDGWKVGDYFGSPYKTVELTQKLAGPNE